MSSVEASKHYNRSRDPISWLRIIVSVFLIAVTALIAVVLMNPSAEIESLVDWIAALGTWSVGLGAMAISVQASKGQEREREEARHRRRREEFASLFTVLSNARRVVEAEAAMTAFFAPDGRELPPTTTIWVLSRLVARIEEAREREMNLSVLSENDQDLIYDFEEDASWVITVATDLIELIQKNPQVKIRGEDAVAYLVDAAGAMGNHARALVESTKKRRDELRPLLREMAPSR